MRSNVQDRQVKWVFEPGGVVSATLYVGGIAIYYSDWYGNPYKIVISAKRFGPARFLNTWVEILLS